MLHLSAIAALACYLAASALFLGAIVAGRKSGNAPHAALTIGVIFQSISLVPLLTEEQYLMMRNGGDYYYWLSWVLAGSYLILRRRIGFPIVGACVASLTTVFLASSSYLLHQTAVGHETSGGLFLFTVHVLPAMVAEVNLLLAFVVSILFLLHERRLKRKAAGVIRQIGPGLEMLEQLNRRFILAGFIFMGLAILTGAIWAVSQGKPLLTDDLTQWLALSSWLVLAFVLHSRMSLSWSARRVSRATVFLGSVFLAAFLYMLLFGGELMHHEYY